MMAKHHQTLGQAHPSPQRLALREAIDTAADTARRRHALAAAKENAASAVYRADAQAAEARALVDAATAASADHLVSVAMGGQEDRPPLSIRQAREAMRDAEDALASARNARAAINAMPDLTDDYACEKVRKAALEVFRAEGGAQRAQAIVQEAAQALAKWSRLAGQMGWMFRNDLYERSEFGGAPKDGRVGFLLGIGGDNAAFTVGGTDLESVIAALIQNADAPSH